MYVGKGPKPLDMNHKCVFESESESEVVSNSLRPHGLWPARLLCPCNFPGKNTGMGVISLYRGSS